MSRQANDQTMTPDQTAIDAYLRHLRNIGHPDTTINTFRTPLTRAAAELPHGLLATTDELEEWLGRYRSRNTRGVYAAALRGFYRWCSATGRLSADPGASLPSTPRRRGVPRPVTDDELSTLLTHAREPVRTWCVLAAYAGLRCVEISRLDRSDVTEEAIYLRGKGDRARAVPCHPVVWQAVRDLPPGPVAIPDAKRLSRRIAREADRLGLADVTAHRLRHWCLTMVQQATGDIRVTQEIAGHASIATTQVYTMVSDQAKRAAVLALTTVTGSSEAGVVSTPEPAVRPGRPTRS